MATIVKDAHRMSASQSPGRIHAFWLFFPAAALWAAIVVPLSLFAVMSGSGWPPGLLGAGHGHELIFGFALALIAGYTLGPQPWRILAPLFGLWLAARLSWLLAPEWLVSQLLSPAFALLLAWQVVPRFQAAKKWRNKIAGPLILALCLLALAYALTDWIPAVLTKRSLMEVAILGLMLLMTFMGGRIIAPAVAGTLEKRGIPLEARVQPRIEGALLIVLPLVMICLPFSGTRLISGALLLLAATLIIVRTVRWKLWRCTDRPDLLVLALGYLWLAAGAGATGVHLFTGQSLVPALHLITIGALGTLSGSVMLRLAWQRACRTFPPAWQVLVLASAMAIAAISRYFTGDAPYSQSSLLWLASGVWALAFAGLASQLLALFLLSKSSSNRAL
ncbi:NnrS family protein [Marinobacter shengliensis]|uniref:NnrS family protein n=1 Tax=Marinobacter shengliensis TaxID=1389223 RepID=UPI001D18D9A3|nr:NnrS family protein [Marinobacter shengliensis]